MTGLALILGLGSIATAIALGVFLLAGPKAVPAGVAGGDGAPARTGAKPARARRAARKAAAQAPGRPADPGELPSVLRRMGGLAAKLTPADYAQRMQRRLDLAGNPRTWSAERLMAFKGLGLVAGALLGILFGTKHGAGLTLLFAAAGAVLGLFLPDVLLRNVGEKRQIEIQKALPDAMDMLTICVEAGLGFDAALSRVARNLTGPVAEEAARVLQEMQFGLSRADALRGLAARTDVAELRSFVSAMVQSGELGISIGDVLREQSKEMRIRRRQRAEERAQKLQVKLLAPLILCLLPAMFIVILGPAVMNIMSFFNHNR